MKKFSLENKLIQWLILLLLSFIWGSSFILIKKGLNAFHNLHVAGYRILFSYLLTLPIAIKNIRFIYNGYLKSLLLVGIVGTAMPVFLFATAQQDVDSSLAGMLNSLTPFCTLIIGLIFYKSQVKFSQVMGVTLGLSGAFMLIVKSNFAVISQINMNAVLIIAATLCYGVNVNEVKKFLHELNGIQITSLSLFFIGPIALIYILLSDYSYIDDTKLAIESLVYIFLLAAFASVLAITIFNYFIKYTTALFAASVTYIIPIFAIFWGVLDGEKITIWQLIWISVILMGVYLVNRDN